MINRTHHTRTNLNSKLRKDSWCCIARKQISINNFNSTLVQKISKSEQKYTIQRIFKPIPTITIATITSRWKETSIQNGYQIENSIYFTANAERSCSASFVCSLPLYVKDDQANIIGLAIRMSETEVNGDSECNRESLIIFE